MIYLIKLFFLIILFSKIVYSNDLQKNKILFKINNKIFTNIDVERRIEYLEIINNIKFSNLDDSKKSEILDDYISSLIFNEYSIENELNYSLNNEINKFYEQNIQNSNLYNNLNEEGKKIINENIIIDLTRKKIIESFLNLNKNELQKKTKTLDLLYNYNLNYVIFKNDPLLTFKIESIKNRNEFLKFISFLKENKTDYILKNEDINDINKISNNLKENLKNNKKIFKNINESYITLYSLEKNLESYEGVFVKLINFISNNALQKEQLNCNFINKIDKKIEFKEYEYSKLNKKIKDNLKSINDYIIINDNENFRYIFLCDLRFNEELLNTINFNKKINTLVEKIQLKFINKYKKEYNFVKFYE